MEHTHICANSAAVLVSLGGRCDNKTPGFDSNYVMNESREHLERIQLARRAQDAIDVLLVNHGAAA